MRQALRTMIWIAATLAAMTLANRAFALDPRCDPPVEGHDMSLPLRSLGVVSFCSPTTYTNGVAIDPTLDLECGLGHDSVLVKVVVKPGEVGRVPLPPTPLTQAVLFCSVTVGGEVLDGTPVTFDLVVVPVPEAPVPLAP